jgi:hypothetical protein
MIEKKRFRAIGLVELHRMLMEAGYHCTDGPQGRVYSAGIGWSMADLDEAADRLACAIIDRINEHYEVATDDAPRD